MTAVDAKVIYARLPGELKAAVDEYANGNNLSITKAVEYLLSLGLARAHNEDAQMRSEITWVFEFCKRLEQYLPMLERFSKNPVMGLFGGKRHA